MASERVLYWGSGSTPAWKAMVALEEKGLEYTPKLIEWSKGTSELSRCVTAAEGGFMRMN